MRAFSRIRRLTPVAHDEELSVVAHLDELRTRLIVSLAVVGVAFGLCFWQNHRLLHLINQPLAHQTQGQVRAGEGPLGATYVVQQSARDVAVQARSVSNALARTRQPAAVDRSLRRASTALRRSGRRWSGGTPRRTAA